MFGSLLYLTTSRPEIAFVIGFCGIYQAKPKARNPTQVNRIMKYINGTCAYGTLYSHDTNSILVGYCDVEWVGSADDRKSVSSGCFFLGNNIIS